MGSEMCIRDRYKALDMSNLAKQDSKGYSKKKYGSNPSELRRKTNSVEPPEEMSAQSPHGSGKYHRHHKSVNHPKHSNAGQSKKTKHYVMSQGNSELKQTLEKAKRKGKALE